ncbi:sensor histidine kinase [Sinisalibacter lacisalsi]|uniref:histidine kinase n=2 Tax=Sinisalibacter lacisalsi TaxID=1526570 RepID=A0ABQ1QQ67_9RHOB|nr:sensor histidine kinase [Sinisalibacter lacisalsi]
MERAMKAEDLFTEERRARLAAERLLAQKEAELHEANRMLSRHAISLTENLVETREQVEVVRGENTKVRKDLARANTEVDIAKRRLWNSIQSIEDGFAVFDADSRMVIANSAYLQPFDGLECIRPGAHYQEIVEAALAEGVVDTEGMSAGQWREEMLARWFSPAPEPRVIRLWDGTWIRLVDQRAPGGDTVCLGLNITEAMRREAALEDARKRAEAANRAKSAFLANMSHEIRTPMNGVVGMADLLAESGLDDDQRAYVDTIRSSGTALLSIINDVLDYSKIEAEKLTLRPEPFDLERTILDVIQLMEPSIREKGLKIMLDYDMFLPTRFEGDPVRIRQVLTNLVGNAVKFTARGHVLVRVVGVPEGTRQTSRIHIVVEDTGIGIPAHMLDHVFGKFNQVEDERNRAFEGTGLGLTITRQLVELMGGKVWVESEEDVGSAFGVQLHLSVVESEDLPQPPGWISRVLLVMQDDLHRAILEKRLAALGLGVTCALSAAEARDGRAAAADVIIADQRLPDMSAAAFIAVLHSDGINAPLILAAAPGEGRAQESGVSAILAKPIARAELTTALAGLEAPAPRPATEVQPPEEAPVFGSRRAAPPEPSPVFGSSRLAPAPARAPEPASTGTADDATPKAVRAMRILAAEDNQTNQLVFSKLVQACDVDLSFAANGADAVAAFEADRPDLIFMDISMPGMDGKEATRRIRAIEAERGLPPVRIVALTAHAMSGDAEEILSHGLDEHLSKPLKKREILAEITAACPANARPPVADDCDA